MAEGGDDGFIKGVEQGDRRRVVRAAKADGIFVVQVLEEGAELIPGLGEVLGGEFHHQGERAGPGSFGEDSGDPGRVRDVFKEHSG